MKALVIFCAFQLLSLGIIGQDVIRFPFSKHKTDLDLHDAVSYGKFDTHRFDPIIPIKSRELSTPTKTVFGYLPYWQYPSAVEYLQYDLLSHISIFDFGITENGDIDPPPNWPWTDVINSSHQNGVKVILTAVNFNGSQIHTLLTDDDIKDALFSNLLSELQQYSLNGVNIDFESVNYSDRGNLLNNFMLELTEYLHAVDSSYEISFAAPPINWGGWDFEGLALSCDYLFIMGYDFYGPWSSTSGPCGPLTGGTYNITTAIVDEYSTVVANNPQKLILGVPYYGNNWSTQNNWAYSNIIDHIYQPTFQNAMNQAEQDTIIWDNQSETSWSLNYNGSDYYQTWFDTDSSIGLKYDFANQHQLKGVGMWALGYDGSRLELWDELRKHFGSPVSIEDLSIHNQKEIVKIYPNPFSGYTNIEIYNINSGFFNIEIIDSYGRIVTSISELKENTRQSFTINIDLTNQSPGIYFCVYRSLSGNTQTTISKKLILQ
ncbi:MAG: T9SS type A sorting domain-containing protein [Bacteroidetes bacterium]|nr:T9SS type A sorting domain-containing protein [Bacteroidota bacterium]